MSDSNEDIYFLESHFGLDVPESIVQLDDAEISAVRELVESAIGAERRSMDGLFDSMTHTMKYIPSFLLQALTVKFIEPPIAARITEKLEFKQTLSIAKGISVDYLAEVSCLLEPEFAARLMDKLPAKVSASVIKSLINNSPVTVLDILKYSRKDLLSSSQVRALSNELEGKDLNRQRMRVLGKLS